METLQRRFHRDEFLDSRRLRRDVLLSSLSKVHTRINRFLIELYSTLVEYFSSSVQYIWKLLHGYVVRERLT